MTFIQNIKRGFSRITSVKTGAAKWAVAAGVGVMALAAPAVSFAGDRDYRRDDDRRGRDYRDSDWRGHDHDRGPRIGFDIRIGEPRPDYRPAPVRVWVAPVYRTVCDRRWVEPVYRTVTDRVWVPDVFEDRETRFVEHGHVHTRVTRVVVVPGHFETRERRECVSEGRFETCDRQELVSEGRWDYR
jgi:hypothetical protein